jgi:hypothetical protein
MAANFFENQVRFNLVDIDGVVLASPLDELLIREPSGTSKTNIILERDKKTHGCNYEFSDAETPFGFDRVKITGELYSPYVFLNLLFALRGVDSKCIFKVERINVATSLYETQYEGNLDFETLSLVDYKVEISSRRINLDDLFRTRRETDVDFSATTSIDGTSITGITSKTMFLHSKSISQSFLNDFNEFDLKQGSASSVTISGSDVDYYSGLEMDSVVRNNIKGFVSGIFTLNELTLGVPYGYFEQPLFSIPSGGLFTINDFSAKFRVGLTGGGTMTIGVYYKVGLFGTESLIGTTKIQTGNFNSTTTNFSVSDTDVKLYLPLVEKGFFNDIYIYIKANITGGSGQTFDIKEGNYDGIISLNKKMYVLDVDFNSIVANTEAEVYSPFDAVSHTLEVINNTTSILESSFLTNLANDIYVTNGYKIRKNTSENVTSNFKELFDEWIQPLLGLGYQIYDNAGTFKLLMEKYEAFYQDVEVDYIDTIIDGSYEEIVDKELVFNEVKVGYKEFPKSTDENKENNIDEFNTRHEVLTPLETIKKKITYESKVIASGYKIENQRREQFKNVPDETVSDDDKLFCIKGIESDEYTGLTMYFFIDTDNFIDIEATYLNLSVSDIITVSGTSLNNTTFTIEEITNNLDGNPFMDIGVRLKVTEVVSVEFDASAIVTKAASFLRAERDEAFNLSSGITDAPTAYNIGLNPKVMLINQSPILNSGFFGKEDTEVMKTRKVFLNSGMTFKFKSGEGGYTLVDTSSSINMLDDLTLSKMDNFDKLFSGKLIKFEARISYARMLLIRAAAINESANSDNFGYLRVKNFNDDDKKGWIMKMDYNLFDEKVSFLLREKFTATGESFDYGLDFELA